MDKLGKILENVVARQPRSATFIELRLRLAVAAVLGADLASGCQVLELRKGTLFITTANAALAHQLRSDSEQVVRRLNQAAYVPSRVRRLQVMAPAWPPSGRERDAGARRASPSADERC